MSLCTHSHLEFFQHLHDSISLSPSQYTCLHVCICFDVLLSSVSLIFYNLHAYLPATRPKGTQRIKACTLLYSKKKMQLVSAQSAFTESVSHPQHNQVTPRNMTRSRHDLSASCPHRVDKLALPTALSRRVTRCVSTYMMRFIPNSSLCVEATS